MLTEIDALKKKWDMSLPLSEDEARMMKEDNLDDHATKKKGPGLKSIKKRALSSLAGALTAVFILALALPAYAQITTFNPTAYAEQIMQYAQEYSTQVNTYLTHVTQLLQYAKQLENMQNLTSFISSKFNLPIGQAQQLATSLSNINMNIGQIESQFDNRNSPNYNAQLAQFIANFRSQFGGYNSTSTENPLLTSTSNLGYDSALLRNYSNVQNTNTQTAAMAQLAQQNNNQIMGNIQNLSKALNGVKGEVQATQAVGQIESQIAAEIATQNNLMAQLAKNIATNSALQTSLQEAQAQNSLIVNGMTPPVPAAQVVNQTGNTPNTPDGFGSYPGATGFSQVP